MAKSEFTLADGALDDEKIEEWAETFFQRTMQMLNQFYAQADLNEVLRSMEAANLGRLAAQELAEEDQQVIETAMKLVDEMAQHQIEYIKAYLAVQKGQ